MSWATELNAVRDWLVATISAQYPTAQVSSEPMPAPVTGPFARISQVGLEFEPETPISDRLTARFEITVRLPVSGSVADAFSLEAAALRSALTGDWALPVDSAMVEKISLEQSEIASGQVEFSLIFACGLVALRGADV